MAVPFIHPRIMVQFWFNHALAGPAATVWPVRPWPYRFLREKNGVAWIRSWLAL